MAAKLSFASSGSDASREAGWRLFFVFRLIAVLSSGDSRRPDFPGWSCRLLTGKPFDRRTSP